MAFRSVEDVGPFSEAGREEWTESNPGKGRPVLLKVLEGGN